MIDKGQRHLVYAYNAQAAVDGHAQVIVSAELTQDETDDGMLLPMVAAVERAMGEKPATITADGGYWDTENVNSDALKGMLAPVNPDGGKKKDESGGCPKRNPNPTVDRMRELLKTDEAKALYKQRKSTVEPVFGHIKQERAMRTFRFQGYTKTRAEWLLICLTHNLLKLYRHGWLPRRNDTEPESAEQRKHRRNAPQKSFCRPKFMLGAPPNRNLVQNTRGDRTRWYHCRCR